MRNYRQFSELLVAHSPIHLTLYRNLIASVLGLFCILPVSANALYQYEYTGNPFTTTTNSIILLNDPPYAYNTTETNEEYISVVFTSQSLLTTSTSINDVSSFAISAVDINTNFTRTLTYPNLNADPNSEPGSSANPNYDAIFDIGAVDANGIPTIWDMSIDYNYRAPTARLFQAFLRTSTDQDLTFGGYEGFSDYLGQINNNPGIWTVSLISPVPEPETYAMLLAGMGLIGCAAKRKKKL